MIGRDVFVHRYGEKDGIVNATKKSDLCETDKVVLNADKAVGRCCRRFAALVAVAIKQVDNLIVGTASDLSAFGISPHEANLMVQDRIHERVEVNRRVLRPDAEPRHEALEKQSNNENGEMSMNETEMKAELERLRAENAQLKSKKRDGLSLKVSDKGAVSLYGMVVFRSLSIKSNGAGFLPLRRKSRSSFKRTTRN